MGKCDPFRCTMELLMPSFYEFFAGGGMARAGLGKSWRCAFANDFDEKKAESYAANWGASHLYVGDVAQLHTGDLPGHVGLAWASFPCQDLSLAGDYAGLKGERSGAFWPFWRLMEGLASEGRAPSLIVLENVCGALSSHGGKDFAAIASALSKTGYRFGALVIDAVRFLPQSRPRLFIIGVSRQHTIPGPLLATEPNPLWHTKALLAAHSKLPEDLHADWCWWNLPAPAPRAASFIDLIEENPSGVEWHDAAQTLRLIEMMNPLHRKKLTAAQRSGYRMVGAIYKRTRAGSDGTRQQFAEIRFDDVAGCLRTPVGGSSRQIIMVVEGKSVRSRLLSPREAARLMGLPDSFLLPANYNQAYHLAGDGLAVPVVRYLSQHLLLPLVSSIDASGKEAA